MEVPDATATDAVTVYRRDEGMDKEGGGRGAELQRALCRLHLVKRRSPP